MGQVTSAAANKMLKAIEDEKDYLIEMENEASVYVMADNEKNDAPEYDYERVQKQLTELNCKARKIKHAINLFNTRTVLESVGLTIDEALVEMAQLNRMKIRLDTMRKRLPKRRCNEKMFGGINSNIEYEYVNYDLDKVAADYKAVSERIAEIQMALDLANQTILFDIEE